MVSDEQENEENNDNVQQSTPKRQGTCWSLKVLEVYFLIFLALKVLENGHGP